MGFSHCLIITLTNYEDAPFIGALLFMDIENTDKPRSVACIDEELMVQPNTGRQDIEGGDGKLIAFAAPISEDNQIVKPKQRLTKKQYKKAQQIALKALIKAKKAPTISKPIISIDTEYTQKGDENVVLSYQYVVSFRGKRCEGIFFPESGAKKHRLSFEQFLVLVIEAALKAEVLSSWSEAESIILVAHEDR